MIRLTTIRTFWIDPAWRVNHETADRVWRAVVAALGPLCDHLWLRFGNLHELTEFLPSEAYSQLEVAIGPHWGVPDPAPRPSRAGTEASVLGAMLPGVIDDFQRGGFFSTGAPAQQPPYAPYGFAVIPVTPDLLDRLVNLSPVDRSRTREMLSRLADHWHFRQNGRDLVITSDGMDGIRLHLTPDHVDAVVSCLERSGLSPTLLREIPDA